MKKSALFFPVAFAFLLTSCGDESSPSRSEEGLTTLDTIWITAVDTIGREFGDSPDVFAFLVAAGFTPDGNIAALDAQKTTLQVFNTAGNELMSVGRSGEGPGEYQMPLGLAILANGFAVSDLPGGKIVRYSSSGEFRDEITDFFPIPPATIAGTNGERYLASYVSIEMNGDDGPQGSTDFVAFGNTSEPEIVFFSFPIDMSDGMARGSAQLHFAGGPAGEAYLALESDSLFILTGYSSAGDEILKIEEEWERIPLTEEELAEDRLSISFTMIDGETSLTTSREPGTDIYRTIIQGVGVDSEGRIWVQMGDMLTPYFRIYSPNGDFTAVAIPDETIPGGAEFSISPNGILAFDTDPVDWPKIYLLELN
jgi:hypothetical protein